MSKVDDGSLHTIALYHMLKPHDKTIAESLNALSRRLTNILNGIAPLSNFTHLNFVTAN